MADMLEQVFLKLLQRDDLAEFEMQALRESVSGTRDFGADETIVEAGQPLQNSNILLEGLACRAKDLADGRRQIMEVHISGDFVDLHSFLLKKLEHNIEALTPCRIAIVPHERLKIITERWPEVRVLAITTFSSEHYLVPALQAGVQGYIAKDSRPDEVIEGIRRVHSGDAVFSPHIMHELIDITTILRLRLGTNGFNHWNKNFGLAAHTLDFNWSFR